MSEPRESVVPGKALVYEPNGGHRTIRVDYRETETGWSVDIRRVDIKMGETIQLYWPEPTEQPKA